MKSLDLSAAFTAVTAYFTLIIFSVVYITVTVQLLSPLLI